MKKLLEEQLQLLSQRSKSTEKVPLSAYDLAQLTQSMIDVSRTLKQLDEKAWFS